MAERTILVCDVCGAPAMQTVGIRVAGRSLQKDVCKDHLEEITKGARAARRGRRKGSTVAAGARPPRRGAAPAAKSTAKSPAKRRGRRRAAAKPVPAQEASGT